MSSSFGEPGGPTGGSNTVDQMMHILATCIEVAGVGVIVFSAMLAAFLYLRQGLRRPGWSRAYEGFRANLGRGILLGLELLVAADWVWNCWWPPTSSERSQ